MVQETTCSRKYYVIDDVINLKIKNAFWRMSQKLFVQILQSCLVKFAQTQLESLRSRFIQKRFETKRSFSLEDALLSVNENEFFTADSVLNRKLVKLIYDNPKKVQSSVQKRTVGCSLFCHFKWPKTRKITSILQNNEHHQFFRKFLFFSKFDYSGLTFEYRNSVR